MKKISALTIFFVVAIWAGSALAHPMQWASTTSEHNSGRNSMKTQDFSGYWLGGHPVTPPAAGKWSWTPDEPDNGLVETHYYLKFWPRDGLWDDIANSKPTAGSLFETNPIPEPATMLLFGIGIFGLAKSGLRRKQK